MIERLKMLNRSSKTAFAAACAQRLSPLYGRYYADGAPTETENLAGILKCVWEAAEGNDLTLDGLADVAESLMPIDDERHSDPAYAQCAAACVAYATSVWQSGDPVDAELAARQVYDAADFAAWTLFPIEGAVPSGTDKFIERQQVVQVALQGIESDLSAVEGASGSDGWDELRLRASSEGEVWCRTLP
ncbi:DUF416 family protein [Arthrobacter alpinus]|nr:DUF416 family protein [Arthrobacter alpinus]